MVFRKIHARKAFQRSLIFAFILALFLGGGNALSAARYAYVFGTNYKGNAAGIPPLDLCERDADLIKKMLKKHGRFDKVIAHLGPMVTAKNIKNALDYLARRVTANDTVVIFFAGHGTYTRNASSPNGLQNTLVMFERPHVSDDQLNDWLKAIKTTKLLWVFDCCFSGGIVKKGRRGKGNVPIAPGQKGKVIENGNDQFYFQNKALIASSDSNETSIEIGGKINHGVFTYWFAQGMDPRKADLNRDQVVTVLEAFEWSSRRVTGMAKQFNHRQHPQISGNASGIILSGKRKQLKPKPPRPSKPVVVKPPPPAKKPTPSPVKPPPTPTKPVTPVKPSEPKVVSHKYKSTVHLYTTILKSRAAGSSSMDPWEILRRNRRGNKIRRVRVLVSGKDVKFRVQWVNRRQLRRLTGEDIDLGRYTYRARRYSNKVAYIRLYKVPTGVHQIEIQADDYPVIRERMGVERNHRRNKKFIVASLAGHGTIRGKVFLKNFERPLKGQDIWMPTVNTVNVQFKMRSLSDGSFWFLNLPPARNYMIKASFLENLPLDNKLLTVHSGGVTRVDVILNQVLRLGR